MKPMIDMKLETGRVRVGEYASDTGKLYGAFKIIGPVGTELLIISSGIDRDYGWEHVSVSTERRTPTWGEMSFVKDLFWREDECVMQLHPPRNEYVNFHPRCLHLWRPLRAEIPTPPSLLVGPLASGE